MDCIVYKDVEGFVAVIHPVGAVDTALKDLPAGAEYIVVGLDDLPTTDVSRWGLFDGVLLGGEPHSAAERLALCAPVSLTQMAAALAVIEVITPEQGLAWVMGAVPPQIEAMIEGLDPIAKIIAMGRSLKPERVMPTDPLVAALAAAQGKTTEDMIDLFELAATF